MEVDMVAGMTQFGVAGLMGALWVWERALSRKRERQLSDAHDQLVRQKQELSLLVRLVRRNTQAIERFDQTQKQLERVLGRLAREQSQRAA